MSQRLDDVTGEELPRLSSRQREQQREAMIAQINAITLQLNAVTAAVRTLQVVQERAVEDVQTCFAQHAASTEMLAARSASFWTRLRWLVTGR